MKKCIHFPPEECYEQAMALLQERYGDLYQVLAAYCREIKDWPGIIPGNASAFRRFFNVLMKCRSILSENNWNQLDNRDMLCMLMAKLPGYLSG